MPYLFTPPLRVESSNPTRENPLRFKTQHALTVYKSAAGVWNATETPPGETILVALYTFGPSGTPVVIDDVTGADLASVVSGLVPVSSQYIPATCVPV